MLDGKVVVDSRRAQIVRAENPPPRTYAVPPEDIEGVPPEARLEVGDHVAVQWDVMDSWYEESEEVFVHPRDPHKRLDVLRSARVVRIELDGEVLAEADRPTLLFESGLPTRYYLDHDDVDISRLRPSDTTTGCPYKGWASYYDVRVAGQWHKDLAWTYRAPLREALPVQGMVCFFNEKVDVFEDGEAQERPRTPFS